MNNVTLVNNTASQYGGGIYFGATSSVVFSSADRCNIYFNNAFSGNDLYAVSQTLVVLDTFSVLHPTGYYATPINNFSFDIQHGKLAQIDADVYVSPSGNNANSGLSSNEPLQTIHHAIMVLFADSLNPHTIHLMPGFYYPTDSETFPVVLPNYINLAGNKEATLSANDTDYALRVG